jgi:Polyketide cyclase / dehydrase and lipid transport
MSTPTDVDRSAPVLAHHDIDISAPLEGVWHLHTEVDRWPQWQKEVTEAHIDGGFEPGATFDWTSYGFSVKSMIYEVEDRSRVLWGGTSSGITGIHEWRFSETGNGVHVETTESFAGDPVESDAATMRSLLDASLVTWLGHLKAAAESS